MTAPTPVIPSQSLLQGKKYVPASHQARDGILAQWKRAQQEPKR